MAVAALAFAALGLIVAGAAIVVVAYMFKSDEDVRRTKKRVDRIEEEFEGENND